MRDAAPELEFQWLTAKLTGREAPDFGQLDPDRLFRLARYHRALPLFQDVTQCRRNGGARPRMRVEKPVLGGLAMARIFSI